MISTRPAVKQDALYGAGAAAKALEIDKSTLYRYTEQGFCQASTRRCSSRKVWLGSELLKLWYVKF